MSYVFTGTSGKEIHINMAGFQEAMRLKNAIEQRVKLADLDTKAVGLANGNFIEELKKMNVLPIIDIILSVDSDPLVNAALMTCLARCTYNGEKITLATFEDEKAREDYYEIVIQCLKINLLPFFKGWISKLNKFGAVRTEENPE